MTVLLASLGKEKVPIESIDHSAPFASYLLRQIAQLSQQINMEMDFYVLLRITQAAGLISNFMLGRGDVIRIITSF